MRKISLLAAAVIFVMAAASTAFAADSAWDATVTVGGQSGYLYQDFGDHAGKRPVKPVTQNELTLTNGALNFDVWTSAELSGRGPYGHRGGDDEWDLSVFYNDKFGSFTYSLFAGYYMLGYKGFGATSDDVVDLHVQIGRPFSWGPAQVTPYVRVADYVPLNSARDAYVLRPGVDLQLPLARRWSLSLDLSGAFNMTSGDKRFRPTAAVNYAFDNGWTAIAGVKASGDADPVGTLYFTKKF